MTAVYHPFNGVFWALCAGFALLLVLASLLMRGKSEGARRAVIVIACALTTVGFFVYKYFLSIPRRMQVVRLER